MHISSCHLKPYLLSGDCHNHHNHSQSIFVSFCIIGIRLIVQRSGFPFSCDSFHLFPTYRQCGPRLRLPSLAQRSLKLKYRQNIHECYVCCLLCILLWLLEFTLSCKVPAQYSVFLQSYTLLSAAKECNIASRGIASMSQASLCKAWLDWTSRRSSGGSAPCKSRCCESSRQPFALYSIVLLFSLVMQQFCNWILSRPKLRVAQIVDVVGRCDQVWSAALETYRHSRAWLTQLYPSFSLRRNLECFQWFGRMCWASFPNQVQSRTQLAGLCSLAKQSVFFPFA